MSIISHGVPNPVEASTRVGVGVRLFPSPWRQWPPSWFPFPLPALGVLLCVAGGPLASVRGAESGR